MIMKYGKELILDIHSCEVKTFTRKSIEGYFKELCKLIKMHRCEFHFWDDIGVDDKDKQVEDHMIGTSAVQFILTSNITIHTLDKLGKVFVNIFSCKEFDSKMASNFTRNWFMGKIVQETVVDRL